MHVRPRSITPLLLLAAGCGAEKPTEAAEFVADSIVLFEMDSATVGIRDVATAPDGSVWAIGTTSPFGHRYSADGRLLERFGRLGRGPGELRSPWAVLPTGDPDAPLEIFDQAIHTLVAFDPAMRELERRELISGRPAFMPLEGLTFGQMRWFERNGSGYLLFDQPDGTMASRSLRHSVLLRFDSLARSIDTLADLRGREPAVEVQTRPLELIDLPLAASCPHGGALLLETTTRVLHRYAAEGESHGRDSLPLPTRPVTDDELRPWLRLWLARMAALATNAAPAGGEVSDEMIDRFLRDGRDWLGTQTPAAVGLLCDARGRAWVQEFSTADDPIGRGRRWRIFEGARHVGTVVLPHGFRPHEFVGDRGLLGVHTEELGLERVARVILPHGTP